MSEYPSLPPLRHIMTGRTDVTLRELSDYTANLPPGCALWRETGGDIAWTVETHMLALVEHRLRVLAWMKSEDGKHGRNKPEPIKAPQSVYERQAEEKRLSARAEAYLRRTGQA